MKFFFDNMLSPRLAKALSALGEDVVALRDYFPQDTPDSTWLAELGDYGWTLVTVDKHIRTRPAERRELARRKITAFFLYPSFQKKGSGLWDQAAWIMRYWPRIREFADGLQRGTCASVQQNGRIELLPKP